MLNIAGGIVLAVIFVYLGLLAIVAFGELSNLLFETMIWFAGGILAGAAGDADHGASLASARAP